ncbi:malonyl CoA-acyl carrier protein transacylase [Pyricularia oryzae Y34]|uniref:[acyl-carrier-protein] S-malonyltransferase n=1 Tax=Pyricularia oryzae (strain Y34) TaxID=1143189 RepID=A0AA97NQF7_PYRO3|nr:malonyl CoA-acyl carrier protein transacylase [Pyricularia oryzae Y34]
MGNITAATRRIAGRRAHKCTIPTTTNYLPLPLSSSLPPPFLPSTSSQSQQHRNASTSTSTSTSTSPSSALPPSSIKHTSTTTGKPRRPRTAIFFPGQGVQKVGMLTPWLENFPSTARPIIQEIDDCLGYKLSDIIRDGPNKLLTATPHAQPAIMATSILILRVLERDFGFSPLEHKVNFVLGHSLGEFAALVAGGYLTFADSLRLVQRRAQAMAAATRAAREGRPDVEYGMVAIVTEPEYLPRLVQAIREFLGHSSEGAKAESSASAAPIEHVSIANVNSKNQIVLSGELGRIKTLVAHVRQFLGHDPRAVRLNSDSPFHSPIMRPAVAVVRDMLAAGGEGGGMVTFPPRFPAWWDSIRYLDQREKVRRWIGIGPGKVGRNLVGKEVGMRGKGIVKGAGVWGITEPSEVEEVLRGLEETEFVVDELD